MRGVLSCIALIAVLGCVSPGWAQDASLTVDGHCRVTDLSLNPNFNDTDDNHSVTGLAVNSFLSAQNINTFGNGEAIAKASGKAGVMKAYSSAAYNYVPDAVGEGGYASNSASVDITDYFTVTSSTLPDGTLTTLNFSYVVNGSVNAPWADQLRPGITAIANGFLEAESNEDSQEGKFSFPDKPLSNFGITVQAKVGETFRVRYQLETGAYLSGNIPDYRFVDSDFYDTAYIYANATDPNVSFTTASGYNYAAAVVPESNAILMFVPGLVGLVCVVSRRRR